MATALVAGILGLVGTLIGGRVKAGALRQVPQRPAAMPSLLLDLPPEVRCHGKPIVVRHESYGATDTHAACGLRHDVSKQDNAIQPTRERVKVWPDIRDQHEPSELSTDDLVACYRLATRLRSFEHGPSLDGALRLWMFTARQELTARGHLERIRDFLPVYIDPSRRNPVFGPRAALGSPLSDEKNPQAVKPLRQIAG